jgi:hypothetical protein
MERSAEKMAIAHVSAVKELERVGSEDRAYEVTSR